MTAKRFVWRKLSAAKWEDVWRDRLSWLGPRLVTIVLAGFKTVRIEAYQLTRREAALLKREFGGDARPAKELSRQELEPTPRPPLRIRGRLTIVSSRDSRVEPGKRGNSVLLIPASLAFGTGDHATTASCLRLLADISGELRETNWEFLDLGTGTGILGLAARRFGASTVDAVDLDKEALRVARANARVNGIGRIRFKRLDILNWRPDRKWRVVAANVYSPILIGAARQISLALERDGWLVLSGILVEQAGAVVDAFAALGMAVTERKRRGKWMTLCLRWRS